MMATESPKDKNLPDMTLWAEMGSQNGPTRIEKCACLSCDRVKCSTLIDEYGLDSDLNNVGSGEETSTVCLKR